MSGQPSIGGVLADAFACTDSTVFGQSLESPVSIVARILLALCTDAGMVGVGLHRLQTHSLRVDPTSSLRASVCAPYTPKSVADFTNARSLPQLCVPCRSVRSYTRQDPSPANAIKGQVRTWELRRHDPE